MKVHEGRSGGRADRRLLSPALDGIDSIACRESLLLDCFIFACCCHKGCVRACLMLSTTVFFLLTCISLTLSLNNYCYAFVALARLLCAGAAVARAVPCFCSHDRRQRMRCTTLAAAATAAAGYLLAVDVSIVRVSDGRRRTRLVCLFRVCDWGLEN